MSMLVCRSLCVGLCLGVASGSSVAAPADLRGHGGAVRAMATNGSGEILTGSFDTRAIVWDAASGAAKRVLRLHEGSVTAVAFLQDGRLATGGQDGRIALWGDTEREPEQVVEAHRGPVSALVVSPDGTMLASSSWDRTVLVTSLEGGAPVEIVGHDDNVNGVAFLSDQLLATASYDGTVRLWSRDGSAGPLIKTGVPLNAVAADARGVIWTAGADGVLRAFGAGGVRKGEVRVSLAPLVGLAVREDLLAVGSTDGTVTILDPAALSVLRVIEASSAPAWSLAFDPESGALLIGGADHVVRPWDPTSGVPLSETEEVASDGEFGDSRGEKVFRKCAACHTLGPDDGNRAGPTLHRIFGRQIGSARGYVYSEALRNMHIVWTPETVARLFEIGPSAMTPGTAMPEQRIADPEDRAALIDFLLEHTR